MREETNVAQGTSKAKTANKTACIVTGGPDGTASVEVGGHRYEPGDKVMLGQDDLWLLEQGYAKEPAAKPAKAEPAPPEAPGDDVEEEG